MKLCLMLCSLLLAPLALATEAPKEVKTFVTVSSVYFKDGHFIIRSADRYVSYMHSARALAFAFDHEQSIILKNETVDFRKKGLSFALQNTLTGDGKLLDSMTESDPELRHLIANYRGGIQVRKLAKNEEKELDAFIKSPEGASKSFQVLKSELTYIAKSVGLEQLIINPSRHFFIANFSTGKQSGSATIKNYKMKKFTVERTADQVDCKNSPIKDLIVAFCAGNIQVVDRPWTPVQTN